ncbi:hypothetical protein [Aquabacterium sp.]|uniref:hypothetical protein n=1 Tax=Aquabacterium sp. TaxID=1872578 RepID=UPI0037847850
MIYIAHFSFETLGPAPSLGYLTTVIEADDISSATAGLRSHLLRLHAEQGMFSVPTEITLVNCVELRRAPSAGLMMQYWSPPGAGSTEISAVLLDASNDDAVSYQSCGEERNPDGSPRLEPFLRVGGDPEACKPP